MKTNFMLSRFIAREELTGLLRLFCGDIWAADVQWSSRTLMNGELVRIWKEDRDSCDVPPCSRSGKKCLGAWRHIGTVVIKFHSFLN
jgi:hypothetical protein